MFRLVKVPYEKTNTDFLFYETFTANINKRARDTIRRLVGTKGSEGKRCYYPQRRFEAEALSLDYIKNPRIITGAIIPTRSDYTDRVHAGMLARQMINSKKTTPEEHKLIVTMYHYPDSSNRQLAKRCGFGNHHKVKRLLDSIRHKFADFK